MNSAIIVIVSKKPEAGRSKTRLVPPLSDLQAAQLAEALLLDSIDLIAKLDSVELGIAYSPVQENAYFEKISPPGAVLLPISTANLTEILQITFDHYFNLGYSKVFAFNGDSPSLPPKILLNGVGILDDHDLVLGPSEDGGYFLIGMQQPNPKLFEGVDWSTDTVLVQTQIHAKYQNLKTTLLPTWYDIDSIDELRRLREELAGLPPDSLKHSRDFFSNYPE